MSAITPRVIDCECGAGAHIRDSIRDGLMLALERWTPVRFKHNGTGIEIHPATICQDIYAKAQTTPNTGGDE